MFKTELLDRYTEEIAEEAATPITPPDLNPQTIGIRDAAFTWSGDNDGTLTPGKNKRNFVLRITDELTFKRGSINLIVGPTGAGKTSMLMALLGEMHYVPSGPGSYSQLPRSGGIAYAAQESWVQNETIRVSVTCRILDDCDLIQLACIGRTISSLVLRLTRRDTTRFFINVVFCAI